MKRTSGLNDLGRVLRERRARLELTQKQVADAAGPGFQSPYIAQIESGTIRKPSRERLEGIARGLRLSYEVLRDARDRALRPDGAPWTDEFDCVPASMPSEKTVGFGPRETLVGVHVVDSRIPGGEVWPNDAEWVDEVGAAANLVGIRVRGNCMADTVRDGEVVIVDRNRTGPELGKVVVWLKDGEWTLKRLRRHNGTWLLVPDNPAYEPIEIDPGQHEILGVVVRVVRPEP